MKQEFIDKARERWQAGHSLEAGRLLYEHIPSRLRPVWAAKVLDVAQSWVSTAPEVALVIEIAKDPSRWPEARDAFLAVRELTLQAGDPLCEGLLMLAENVAKVTYNASGHSPPFDQDAGWWIVQNLKYLTEQISDPEFTANAWSTLSDKRFVQSQK